MICTSGGSLVSVFLIPLRVAMVLKSNVPYFEDVAASVIFTAR
jgi:uncharacterized oligopeptide transporter (OPT) family protein